MKKLFGNTSGLRADTIRALENLSLVRTPPEFLITRHHLEALVSLSSGIRRQIGILIDRSGKAQAVIIGDAHGIEIPETPDYRATPGRLKGLRLVHTHLDDTPLTREDLSDLAILRLDYIAAVCCKPDGGIGKIYMAHILPGKEGLPYEVLSPSGENDLDMDCLGQILALERELQNKDALYSAGDMEERALLINANTGDMKAAKASMDELKELCRSSGIQVVGIKIQRRRQIDPKTVVGKGKLSDLIIVAVQNHATLLIFDRELNPSQLRTITDIVEMKVIDRTQLILDIFARHAKSREGKLQVELAQMKYLLPRLVTKNTAMSRLTGGIGGRGPGETKLEINRRRVRERIAQLSKAIEKVRKQRRQQRSQRNRKGVPVISIVGYTNAGKSTLLNALTHSNITAANRLFATLDPSSRRLKFPKDIEVIITDTVGFIQDLPDDLMEAFHATLEELEEADILLHVIDISNPRYRQQMDSVQKILVQLNLDKTPCLYVFNKVDSIPLESFDNPWLLNQGVMVSAIHPETLKPLVSQLESMVKEQTG